MSRVIVSYGASVTKACRFRLFMLLYSSVIVPIIATGIVDSRCFNEWFFGRDLITCQYGYSYCITTHANGLSCVAETRLSETLEFEPPFVYSGQCSTAIITKFVPILVYMYTFLGLSIPLLSIVISATDGGNFPSLVYSAAPGMYWPENAHKYKQIVRANSALADQMLHLCVLCTYGLTSPLVAVSVTLVIISNSYFCELYIGRFLSQVLERDLVLWPDQIERDCKLTWRSPRKCLWLVIMPSALFFGSICSDMAADQISIGVAVVFFVVSSLFSLFLYLLVRFEVLSAMKLKSLTTYLDSIFQFILGDSDLSRFKEDMKSREDGILMTERLSNIITMKNDKEEGRDYGGDSSKTNSIKNSGDREKDNGKSTKCGDHESAEKVTNPLHLAFSG